LIDELEKTRQTLEDKQGKDSMADAVSGLGQMINQLQSNQAALAQTMNAPKTVVRDKNGKIIGMKAGE
jgi:uncharacterized protein YoxC